MTEKETLVQNLETLLIKLKRHKEISNLCDVGEIMLGLHDAIISYFEEVKDLVAINELSTNYIIHFQNDINTSLRLFPFHSRENLDFISEENKEGHGMTINQNKLSLEKHLELLKFNIDFFKKLNFFNSNIVAIGANGSGKTTLSNELKKYLPTTGIVISAQKVLIIPTFSGVSNFNDTSTKLGQFQTIDKSTKITYSTASQGNSWSIMTQIGGEFQVILDNLIAERSVIRNEYFNTLTNGQVVTNVPFTRLDRTLEIWNSLIQHRILECLDGINITLKPVLGGDSYPAYQMSDGEKVALYLIAHIIQAPSSGFIVIDEPEMYLHKTILKKLWDILEQERKDCIFIYLTHDLEFATSRTAKKIWIKSFNHPNNWEIENIPSNDLPEALLLELLGSRKNILFCEGKKGGADEKIYNILFPNFTITPVASCFSVINYTKAFNKLEGTTTVAYGLIDSDHHEADRLDVLKQENIFSFAMTELENLFFDEDFLKLLAKRFVLDDAIVEKIKLDVIKSLEKDIELQVSNFISTKINYYFSDSHVSKGNTLESVMQNYTKFTDEIKIHEWYYARERKLKEIIADNNYLKTLSIFNNKGLKTIANKHFKTNDFSNIALRYLQFEPSNHDILRKYFPNELVQ